MHRTLIMSTGNDLNIKEECVNILQDLTLFHNSVSCYTVPLKWNRFFLSFFVTHLRNIKNKKSLSQKGINLEPELLKRKKHRKRGINK